MITIKDYCKRETVKLKDVNEYNELLDKLKADKFVYLASVENKCGAMSYLRYGNCYTQLPYSIYVCYAGKTLQETRFVKYTLAKRAQTNEDDDNLKGSQCYKIINKDNQLVKAYGHIISTQFKSDVGRMLINSCKTLRPIIYLRAENNYSDKCHKMDISSAYPSCSYDLPTLINHKIVNGIVNPTDDYPFVIYDNGHVAIKEKNGTITDTRNYVSEYWQVKIKPITKSLLLKRSNDNLLFNLYKDLYQRKSTDPEAKQILNFSIGFMRSEEYNKSSYQGHISAIIYARHISKMAEHINDLTTHGDSVLHILTDSLIFSGDYQPYTTTKVLGKAVLEYEDKYYHNLKSGQYVFIEKTGQIIKDSLHTQGFKSEVKDLINNLADFNNIQELGKNATTYIYDKITRRWY